MPFEKEKQGLPINDYTSRLKDKRYALRVGEEVPEGAVNLAYIHTPKVQVDENVSLIDTSFVSDNMIPQDQLESMVVANAQGELEYVDLLANNQVRPRQPRGTFPSKKISLTSKFKKNEMQTENALYYKIELDYHYDSKKGIPNDKGEYPLERYTGEQIELTDENGNALDEKYKYEIYVQAQAYNPRIYSVTIYMHKNTNEIETLMVRYNHIDQIVKDEHAYSVKNQVELYTGSDNLINVDGKNKQMLEGGKLRVVNGTSSFEETSQSNVQSAMLAGTEEELFAVVPNPNGAGYKVIVSQRSESDPRAINIFSHRITASYEDYNGKTVKVSVGHISDWCINPEALLKNETADYSGEYKNIGMPAGGGKFNAKEMIEISLPFGSTSIPSDAQYAIEDDKGNLLYSIKNMNDNAEVATQINAIMSKTPEAKSLKAKQKPWSNAMKKNSVLKESPITHLCTVIPETQQTKFDFEFSVDGTGYYETYNTYKTTWRISGSILGLAQIEPKVLDANGVNGATYNGIGYGYGIAGWKTEYSQKYARETITYTKPDKSFKPGGYYPYTANLGRTPVDYGPEQMINFQEYEFSTNVIVEDPGEGNIIGLLFRVHNAENYFIFAWERDETFSVAPGETRPSRTVYTDRGMTKFYYDPSIKRWDYVNDKDVYEKNTGFGLKKKRVIRATPGGYGPYRYDPENSPATWDVANQVWVPNDNSWSVYQDVTVFDADYNPKGWMPNKEYKMTVVTKKGFEFAIYINENPNSKERGDLVCRGSLPAGDSWTWRGGPGLYTFEQSNVHFSKPTFSFYQPVSYTTEDFPVEFDLQGEKLISTQTALELATPAIEKAISKKLSDVPDYKDKLTMSVSIDGVSTIRIDGTDNKVYATPPQASLGVPNKIGWSTAGTDASVKGKGTAQLSADGKVELVMTPSKLPMNLIPTNIKNFKWDKPTVKGPYISMTIDAKNEIIVTVSAPPITVAGTPYVLELQELYKADGIKMMEYLFDTGGEKGFYDKLKIPSSIPKSQIMLRIERGRVTGIASDGTATTQNADARVNYRFRIQKNGMTRMPVDQNQNELGVNRIRFSDMMKGLSIDPDMKVDVVAWTTFQDLEVVPLFAIKIEEDRKIAIEKPKVELENMEFDNWYLRVKNGRFVKRVQLPYHETGSMEKPPEIYLTYPQLLGMVTAPDHVVEVELEYTLPEYSNQEFQNRPFILVEDEAPVVLNEYAIQTRYAPIVSKSETGESYLEVYSIRGEQKRPLRVSDMDAKKGIIYLHDRIREQDTVHVQYAYVEDWYTYRGFRDKTNFFHLDLNPTPGHQHTIAVNGFHRWIPSNSNKESYVYEDVQTKELLVKPVHVYMMPSSIRKVVDGRTDAIINGTIRTETLMHTDEEWWFNEKDYRYDASMLRLGKVMLQANSTMKENMTILDTRTRGGGLDEALSKEIIKQINKESMYNWDIGYFDGEAYQENGVIVIRVPRTVLKSDTNPNGFHESEVQAAVAKHKGFGVLPIIEYYDVQFNEMDYNIIPNSEFVNNTHIGYYDPGHSKGLAELLFMNIGTGDNYVLRLTNDGEYAITIPGHKFTERQYRLDIKALKEITAPDRSVGMVEIHKKDGTVEKIQLAEITRPQWMIYKQLIDIDADVHHISIILNKTGQVRTGGVIYDYVTMVPTVSANAATTEIHEF